VILDACRNNPLARAFQAKQRSLGVGRGLAVIEGEPANTLIAYATAADATASDGAGEHSPFTAALLEHLTAPGVELRLVMGRVRDTVIARTGGEQRPFTYGSLGGDEFYFVPKPAEPERPDPPPPAAPGAATRSDSDQRATELAFWQSAERRDTRAAYEAYRGRFCPGGDFCALADDALEQLQTAALPPEPDPERTPLPPPPAFAPSPAELEAALGLTWQHWRQIQGALTALGFDTGGSDGRPGPATRRAVADWQATRHQEATGYLGFAQDRQIVDEARRGSAAAMTPPPPPPLPPLRIRGDGNLRWHAGGVLHDATLRMDGTFGVMRVAIYVPNPSGMPKVVEQDMRLVQRGGHQVIEGGNLRFLQVPPGTAGPYMPDVVVVRPTSPTAFRFEGVSDPSGFVPFAQVAWRPY
jgi:hypothetical protein